MKEIPEVSNVGERLSGTGRDGGGTGLVWKKRSLLPNLLSFKGASRTSLGI